MLEICVLCLNLNPSQFRFHRRMQSYTELASVHGHVSISNDFWCPVFVPSGKETFRGWSLGSFPERRVVVEPWPYTSFLHATGISKLESVVCGGRLEEVVNFELSCLIRNDVRCMLFVTCLFSCSFGILKLGIFFRKCRLSHLSHRFYYIETGMT